MTNNYLPPQKVAKEVSESCTGLEETHPGLILGMLLHSCPCGGLPTWCSNKSIQMKCNWLFPKKGGTPKIIDFNRVFHYKPSILVYHYFWKPPYHCFFCQIDALKDEVPCYETGDHVDKVVLFIPSVPCRGLLGHDLNAHQVNLAHKRFLLYNISVYPALQN